jgi:hypothetical protein
MMNILKNKTVALVGPAFYMTQAGIGADIENHDVVVRLNKSLPVLECLHPHVGKRTDVLMTAGTYTDVEDWFNPKTVHGLAWVRSPFPVNVERAPFFNRLAVSIAPVPFSAVSGESFHSWWYGTVPLTGTAAIYDLLGFPIKSLSVYGITCFLEGGYHAGYGHFNSDWLQKMIELESYGHHNRWHDLRLIRDADRADKRLHLDEMLTRIIKESL